MTLNELHSIIADATWFSRLGEARENCVLASSSEDWQWLPTSREQADPIHGDRLMVRRASDELTVVKLTLASLRSVPDSVPELRSGPHDYTHAARGGVQLAARFATREIANDVDGFWCDVSRLMTRGSWPCGLTGDLRVVVW